MIKKTNQAPAVVLINGRPYVLTFAEIPEFFNACHQIGILPNDYESVMQRIINRLQKDLDHGSEDSALKQDVLFLQELDFMLLGFLLCPI